MSAPISKQTKLQVLKLTQSGKLDELIQLCTTNNIINSLKQLYHEKSGDSLMSYACRQENLALVQWLHKTCCLDLEQGNFDGKRPIHEAAQFGNLECVKYLVECGVSVNAIKKADWTPLMLACTKTNLQVIEELVNSAADTTLQNKDAWNCFHMACREGDLEIVTYLHNKNPGLADTVSKNGRTPLHTAALHGHNGVLRYLLDQCHYKVDVKDSCGTTPLMDAIRADNTDTAHILVNQYGASVTATDNMGRQCIHLAAQAGSLNSIAYLLKNLEVCVNTPSTVSGITALHLACKEGQHSAAEILLSHDADINETDKKGRTALHIAAGSQHTACVDLLLRHKAQDRQDHSGTFAKDLARKANVVKLFNDLVKPGT